MSAFVDPKAAEELEIDGTIFLVRALTAREKFPLMADAEMGNGDQVEFGAKSLERAVSCGLVGWKGIDGNQPPPEWSRTQDENVDALTDKAYMAIGGKVIDLTFLSAEDKKK